MIDLNRFSGSLAKIVAVGGGYAITKNAMLRSFLLKKGEQFSWHINQW